jgi:hypothetical protein
MNDTDTLFFFILGASDPEMAAIEAAVQAAGHTVAYATVGGKRVLPATAYRADGIAAPVGAIEAVRGGALRPVLVECGPGREAGEAWSIITGASPVVVDHHRPGDPGYGKEPVDFMSASSLGQTLALLGLEPSEEQRLVAAADHCLAAAYQGRCPGVDPDRLMAWRAASRAAFQGRPVEDILRDVEAGRKALREAPELQIAPGVFVKDLRGIKVPELPEASAREAVCFIADGLPDGEGRVKVVCQSGTPAQISAFMSWAPTQGMVDVYGDPQRGFAGAYIPPAS